MSSQLRRSALLLSASAALALAAAAPAAAAPYINGFSSITTLHSTVPASGPAMGDQNPYGVAVVPSSKGDLTRGDVLVSNFNNAANHQGTGSSIVEISPTGGFKVFAVVPRPTATKAVGLTTALVALKHGFVVVGSLPAPDGMSSAATAGALTILDAHGHVVKTITGGLINGPWDMTAVDHGRDVTLFVTNVLNGTVAAAGANEHDGTVVRIRLSLRDDRAPEMVSETVIAKGFIEHTDPNALVVGPTGVGLGPNGTLYVADSADNRIAAVPDAMTRTTSAGRAMTLTSGGGLNDPLGLTIAPNGDVITANGNDGNIVETDSAGMQVAMRTLVPDGAGDLFGLAVVPHDHGLYFVNDAGSGPAANSLEVLHN
jgi:sugar lactone lactonase YvrE